MYLGDRDRFPDDRYPSRYPPSTTDSKIPYDRYPVGTRPDYGKCRNVTKTKIAFINCYII